MFGIESAEGNTLFQGLARVGFVESFGESPFLGEELGRDETTGTGLEGEVFGSRGGPFRLDAVEHVVDGLLPVRLPGSDAGIAVRESGEGGDGSDEPIGGRDVAAHRTGACERLDLPEAGAAVVVIEVGRLRVDE